MSREVSVTAGLVRNEGGCNGCTEHEAERVAVMTFRGLTVRLCRECLKALRESMDRLALR